MGDTKFLQKGSFMVPTDWMAEIDITHMYRSALYSGYTEICKFNTCRGTEMTQDTDATLKLGGRGQTGDGITATCE